MNFRLAVVFSYLQVIETKTIDNQIILLLFRDRCRDKHNNNSRFSQFVENRFVVIILGNLFKRECATQLCTLNWLYSKSLKMNIFRKIYTYVIDSLNTNNEQHRKKETVHEKKLSWEYEHLCAFLCYVSILSCFVLQLRPHTGTSLKTTLRSIQLESF